MEYKGLFITLEGGEGVGKTTQMQAIELYLSNNNIPFITTREPGGITISESIRNIILDRNNTNMDGKTEALLYAAARRQHLVEKVIPALKDGKVVICDRFIDSSLAYQGYAREIGMKEVLEINKFAIDDCMPDLTIFLDLDVKVGLSRVKSRNGEVNRLDLEKVGFHEKVRQGYMKLLQSEPNRIKKIDANKSIEKVTEEIINIMEKELELKGLKKI